MNRSLIKLSDCFWPSCSYYEFTITDEIAILVEILPLRLILAPVI